MSQCTHYIHSHPLLTLPLLLLLRGYEGVEGDGPLPGRADEPQLRVEHLVLEHPQPLDQGLAHALDSGNVVILYMLIYIYISIYDIYEEKV